MMSSPTNPPNVSSPKDHANQPSTPTPTPTPLPKGEYLRRLGPHKPAKAVTSTTPSKQPLTPPPFSSSPQTQEHFMTPSTIAKMSVDEIIASYSKSRGEERKFPVPEKSETETDPKAQATPRPQSTKRKRSLREAASLRYPSTGTRRNVKREFADLTGDKDEPVTYKAITEDEARKLSGLPPKEYVFPSLLDLLQD